MYIIVMEREIPRSHDQREELISGSLQNKLGQTQTFLSNAKDPLERRQSKGGTTLLQDYNKETRFRERFEKRSDGDPFE